MYSLFKNNNSIMIKTKYIVKGKNLSKWLLQKKSKLSPVYVTFSSGIVTTQNYSDRSHLLNRIGINSLISTVYTNNLNNRMVLYFLTQNRQYATEPGKPSSKVEETVTALKEKAKEQKMAQQVSIGAPLQVTTTSKAVAKKKKNWKKVVMDELTHYYHGFRLLFIDIKVSSRLTWRLLRGYSLTRREHKLLVRTVGDLFRLVPFSVFIIVPFLEFTLPFFIKLFPGMLPSTFETATEKEDKMKRALKVKLEMAKFLQKTLDDMAVASKGHSSEAAKEFAQFFEKVRTTGNMITSDDIMKFSKLFEDEITLDSLPRPQLMALCRVLEMNPIGTTNFLRFQLRLKLRSLVADDMMIQLEGINSLSQQELQAACRARGMRAFGVSEERLKAQLNQWLELSLVKKVPPSLLLLSQAFMLPETTPTEEKLAATIQALPDHVCTATKAVIGEREGKVDYKTKIEMIKEEVQMIKEERLEEREEQAKLKEQEAKEAEKRAAEELEDKAPVLEDKAKELDPALKAAVDETSCTSAPGKLVSDVKKESEREKEGDEERSSRKQPSATEVTSKDIEALENAIDNLGKYQKKLIVEKEELQELREEMKEYQEDVADLQKLMLEVGKDMDIKETKAAQRLFKKVNHMITKIDTVLNELEKKDGGEVKKEEITEDIGKQEAEISSVTKKPEDAKKVVSGSTKTGDETLRIDDLIATIRKLHSKEDTSRLERIKEILSKMDADRDGAVRVDVVLKMLDLVGHENVKLSKKQVDELIALIDKEEVLVQETERKKVDAKKDSISSSAVEEIVDKKLSNKKEKENDPPDSSQSPGPSSTPTSTFPTDSGKNKMDSYITTASIKTPPKSSNTQQSIAEPSSGSSTPKHLR